MPAHINQDESAWFYHSTFENPKAQKPAPKPLMSQIPGINGSPDDEAAGQSKSYFKDTDSKYVRLAKQGGRRDLLNYQEFDDHKEAVAYPRVDWFYLEDNAAEDAKKKKNMNWQFGVPDYMSQNQSRRRESGDQRDDSQKVEVPPTTVNNHNMPDSLDSQYAGEYSSNPSAHCDQTRMLDRETAQDTSKTMTLPELRRDRNQNTSLLSHSNYNIERVKAVVPEQQFKNPITQKDSFDKKPAGLTRKQGNNPENNQVSMSKLLSHSYGKEWHDQLKDLKIGSRRIPPYDNQELNLQTENNNKYQTSNRNKLGDEEGKEKIHFIDNGRSMDECEKSKANLSTEYADLLAANYADDRSFEAVKDATINK